MICGGYMAEKSGHHTGGSSLQKHAGQILGTHGAKWLVFVLCGRFFETLQVAFVGRLPHKDSGSIQLTCHYPFFWCQDQPNSTMTALKHIVDPLSA